MRRLIIRPGAIGDVIVSLPALECLRGDYTEVWTRAETVPLLRFADNARAIGRTGLDLLGVTEAPPRLLDTLRGFDSIVSWYGSNRPEFREAVAGLPFRFFTALPPGGYGTHAADFYLRQARELAPCAHDGVPRIPIAAPRGDHAVIHPFASSPRKRWPLERFREAAARIGMPVRWCAGPEEALEDAVRFEDLGELARFLAGARLFLGNDSGIAHLAAAVGTPVVALFGPTDPAVWAPRGPHVSVVARPALDSIGVDEVIATIRNRGIP